MMNCLEWTILEVLFHSEKPLTRYGVSKTLGVVEPLLTRHLKRMVEDGIILESDVSHKSGKTKRVYFVKKNHVVCLKTGIAIFGENNFIIYNCPYQSGCNDKITCGFSSSCRLWKEEKEKIDNFLASLS